jgi:hypothetical protein
MIPAQLWRRPELSFSSPNSFYHANQEGTEAHLPPHRELGFDDTFSDPLITTRASLIGWQIGVSDGGNYGCPFLGNGCNFKAQDFTKLKKHLLGHANPIIR